MSEDSEEPAMRIEGAKRVDTQSALVRKRSSCFVRGRDQLSGSAAMPSFGGEWTEKKLERVEKYLIAYQIALKKQKFNLVYIDAFCGDGSISRDSEDALLLEEMRRFTTGSARRALALNPPFQKYYFIDKSRNNIRKMEIFVKETYPHLENNISYCRNDVNIALPMILAELDPSKDRAVMFADPYGMQLDWMTVEHIAACPVVDFWYLVPTGAINRLLKRKGEMPGEWAERLDRFLGDASWREKWYEETDTSDLFDVHSTEVRRVVNFDEVEEYFYRALKTAFPKVAVKRLRLYNSKGSVLFTLMFACSNPNPRAHDLAARIANHLLSDRTR